MKSLSKVLIISALIFSCSFSPSFAAAPHLIYTKDGKVQSGQDVLLRGPKDVQKVLNALQPLPYHMRRRLSFVPKKPAMSAGDKRTHVDQAWKDIERIDIDFEDLRSRPVDMDNANQQGFLLDAKDWALSIIGAYGDRQDIGKLLDQALIQRESGMDYIYDPYLITAAAVQQRLGSDIESFIQKSEDVGFDNPYLSAAYLWAAGLNGNAQALSALVKMYNEIYDELKVPGMWNMHQPVRLLAAKTSRDESVLALMRRVLKDYMAATKGLKPDGAAKISYPLMSSVPYALTYLQAYGTDDDRASFKDIGLLRNTLHPVIYAAVDNPVRPARVALDKSLEPDYMVLRNPEPHFCAAFFDRDAGKIEDYYLAFRIMWGRNEPPSNDPRHKHMLDNTFSVLMSRCYPSENAARIVLRETELSAWELPWIKQKEIPKLAIDYVKNSKRDMPSYALGYYDMSAMKAAFAGQGKYGDLLVSYLELLETIHVPHLDVISGARRAFVRQVSKIKTTLSGVVDVKPRVKDGKLQVGIRFALYSSVQGLAAKISGQDETVRALQEKKGLPLLDTVMLERPDLQKELTFVRSTDSGVHIFEMDFDGKTSESWLRVQLSTLEDSWTHVIPLYTLL